MPGLLSTDDTSRSLLDTQYAENARGWQPTSMFDVPRVPVGNTGDFQSQPVVSVQQQLWGDIFNSLQQQLANAQSAQQRQDAQSALDYHLSQHPRALQEASDAKVSQRGQADADVMLQAILTRQRQERR